MAAELGIIIVSYNAKSYLKDCLESVKPSADSGFCEVVVVDNASTDGSAELVKSKYKWVYLIINSDNLGFAEANNIGIKNLDTDYILLLNSDTIITQSALENMLSVMKNNDDIAICGCQHIDKDGIIQNPFGKFPSLKSEFITMTGIFKWPLIRHLITYRKRRRLKGAEIVMPKSNDVPSPRHSELDSESSNSSLMLNQFQHDADLINKGIQKPSFSYVDYVSGASMMITKVFASKTGGLDNRFFFYSEDADICFTARKMGYKVVFTPDIIITHFGGGSYGSNYLKVLRQWMLTRITFFNKNYNKTKVALLLAVYALCGILSVIKWAMIYISSPSKRGAAKQWLSFWRDMLA